MTNRRTGLARVGLSAIIAGLLLATFGFTAAASASVEDDPPEAYEKNKTCQNFGYDFGFKLEPQGIPEEKGYIVPPSEDLPGGATITISNVETVNGRVEFDWSSDVAWSAVMVKQADGGLIYEYDPPVMSDQNVQTVEGKNSGGISHVNFCGPGEGEEECEPGQLGTFPDCQDPCVYDGTIPADDPACGVCEEGQTGEFPSCVDPEPDLAATIACGVPTGMKVTITNTGDGEGTVDVTSNDVVVHDEVLVPAGQSVERVVDIEEDTAYDIEVVGVQAFTGTRDCVQVGGVVIPKTPEKPAVQVAGVQVAAQQAAQELPRTGDDELTLAMIGLGLILVGAGAVLISRDRVAAWT